MDNVISNNLPKQKKRKEILSSPIFNSRIRSRQVTASEKWLGYFLGPISVSLMNGILSSYLNVYYTDVIDIASIWGGLFLSAFPIISKIIDAVTFIVMGRIVDRTVSRQGKARPWILFSSPVLILSMVLLFAVPAGNDWLRAVWIFVSYNLFYSVGYTAYSTSHTLLVPLSTRDEAQRSSLSLITNSLGMLSGTFLAILFPCFLVPAMGVSRSAWMAVIAVIVLVCCPLLLMEYFYTRERVTEEAAQTAPLKSEPASALSLKEQLRCCLKSRSWIIVMVYMVVMQLFSALSSASIFYYCNWVLGSYNDGFTQALYYGLGNAPLGLGVFLCRPICKKLGRRNAMMYGFLLAASGCLLCVLNPLSLSLVLIGQLIKAVGLIPSAYMVTTLLADALDDVEVKSSKRCDGFSSSVFNIITTVSAGAALCLFNFFLTHLGYQAPAADYIPVQNGAVKGFFILCALGSQVVCYLILAALMFFSQNPSGKPSGPRP